MVALVVDIDKHNGTSGVKNRLPGALWYHKGGRRTEQNEEESLLSQDTLLTLPREVDENRRGKQHIASWIISSCFYVIYFQFAIKKKQKT